MTSLTRRAVTGIAWNWGGSLVLVVAQIASTAATARLVSPREFGLYATAQAAAGLAGYFTMTAVGQDLQRRQTLDSKTIGTAVAISACGAVLVGLTFALFAEPWARVWGVPDAAHVVRLFAVVTSLTALSAVPIALLRRRLAFGQAALIETASIVIGLGAGVALAVALHSAVALALGQVAGSAILTISATALTRHELALNFDRADARRLATFGGQIGALGFGSYVANIAPSWFAARVFGASVLGLYSRAHMIVSLPETYATTSIFKVVYPLYGHVRESRERTRALLSDGLTLTTGAIWPFFALVAGAAPVIVEVLLGSRWSGAAPYVALVALGACANVPTGLLTNAAEALGWIKVVTIRLAAFLTGVAAAMGAVFLAGLELSWLLLGVALSQWAVFLLTLRPFVRRGLLHPTSIARVQTRHAAVALGAYALAAGSAAATASAPLAAQAIATAVAGLATISALAAAGSRYPAGELLGIRLRQAFPTARSPQTRVGATSQ